MTRRKSQTDIEILRSGIIVQSFGFVLCYPILVSRFELFVLNA